LSENETSFRSSRGSPGRTRLLAAGAFAEDKKKDPEAIGDRDVGKGVNFYSLEKEIALGKQLAQEVERQAKIIDDPIIAEYVNRVGQNIVRNSDAKVPFTIKVLDSEEVNAFALPGGFFFVNSGLILKADTEAELAGVMAHEIAHVAARPRHTAGHPRELINIGTIPLIFMGGWTGYIIRQGAGFGNPHGLPAVYEGVRKGSDYLGLQYLYKSGYDPTALSTSSRRSRHSRRRSLAPWRRFLHASMTDDRIKSAQTGNR